MYLLLNDQTNDNQILPGRGIHVPAAEESPDPNTTLSFLNFTRTFFDKSTDGNLLDSFLGFFFLEFGSVLVPILLVMQ